MRYEHPDPALSAAVTELLRSTSRVKPLERRLKAIKERASELPNEPEFCRRAVFHASLALQKKKREEEKAVPKGRVRR